MTKGQIRRIRREIRAEQRRQQEDLTAFLKAVVTMVFSNMTLKDLEAVAARAVAERRALACREG
jgi:hypothetical protein